MADDTRWRGGSCATFVRLEEAVAASTSLGPSTGTPRAAAPNRPAQRCAATSTCAPRLVTWHCAPRCSTRACVSWCVVSMSWDDQARRARLLQSKLDARLASYAQCASRAAASASPLGGAPPADSVVLDMSQSTDPAALEQEIHSLLSQVRAQPLRRPSRILTSESMRLCSPSCPRRSMTRSCRRHRPSWSPCSGTGNCCSSSSVTLGGPRPACSRRWTESSCLATSRRISSACFRRLPGD